MRMMRQQVASTATGSRPATSTPTRLGDALNGPVAFHADDTVHDGELARKNACRSAMDSSMPAQCSTFFGQP